MARLTPPKSPIVYDKHHSGCMWGLYSLFEFQHGNSSRKLLSDRKRFKRDVADGGNVRQRGSDTELDAKCRGKDERNENLINPDMANEKKLESKETMKSMHSVSELDRLPKINGKATKPSQRPSHATLHGQIDSVKQKQLPHPNLVGKSVDKLKKKKHGKQRRGCGCKNVDFVKYDQLLKVNDVAEAIVNQKLIEGKYLSRDGVNQQSKQLLDALEILNSNKDLFTKLLQDPNSLLVKHIQDLRESQEQKQRAISLSEAKTSELQPLDKKFQPKGRSGDPQPSEIVVLKPGPVCTQSSSEKIDLRFEEHVHSGRPTHFSFGDIKRKFRHAMGVTRKDQNLILINGAKYGSSPGEIHGAEEVRRKFQNAVRVENKVAEMSSFDIQKRDKIEKLREFKARIGQETASSSESGHRRSESRMYVEDGRRHYSETIINKNEDNNFFQKQAPNKLLQRATSSPEYDFLHLHSTGRDVKSGFVASQMRFSPYSYSLVPYDRWRLTREQKASYASSLKHNIEELIDSKKSYSQLQVTDFSHTTVLEANRNAKGDMKPMEVHSKLDEVHSKLDDIEKNDNSKTSNAKGSEKAMSSERLLGSDGTDKISSAETSDVRFWKETNVLEAPYTNQSNDMESTNEETKDFECSGMDSSVDDQPSTSSSDAFLSTPSSIQRADGCDASKGIGESSPISVLEQFFTDDASPPSTADQSEETQSSTTLAKPRVDPESSTTSSYVYGTISEYVKTVIQASSLNSNNLILKCHESDQMLEAVTSQANQFCGDCKLLFDCISEVLVEIHDAHLRPSPWISFAKPRSFRPLQTEKFVAQEAMKRIGCYFKPESTQLPLDKLIENDLEKSWAWLDIRSDGEDVIGKIADAVLEELVMETIIDLHI